MRFRRLLVAGVVSLVVALAPASAAGAQASPPVQGTLGTLGTLVPIPYRSFVAINPLGIPFDIFSVEIENAVAPGITVGGTGSYTDVDGDRFTSADLTLRYYPGEVVLRGFSIGASAGYLRYSTDTSVVAQPTSGRVSLTAPTLGIMADYNWMLGTRRRFLVGTGLGAKRVLASSDARAATGLDRAYVTARFVVGLAF